VINLNKKPYIIAFCFFILDLISKQIIVKLIDLHQSIKIIKNFFYLTYTRNTGAAFSILEDERMLFLIITIIALFFINKYMNKEKIKGIDNFIYGMLIGGILGNLFDRIVYGYVIDFLDFKIFGYNYPIFNLADTFIVIGACLLIICSFIDDLKMKKMRSSSYGKN